MPPPTTAIYKALMLPPSLWGADRRVVYSGHFFDATAFGRLNTPSVWRTNRTQAAAKVDGMASAGMDDIEIPAFLRKQSVTVNQRVQSSTTAPDAVEYAVSSDPSLFSQLSSKIKDLISPNDKPHTKVLTDEFRAEKLTTTQASKVEIAMALNTAALQAASFRIALQHTLKLNMPSNYAAVIIDLTKVTKDSATSWALLSDVSVCETNRGT